MLISLIIFVGSLIMLQLVELDAVALQCRHSVNVWCIWAFVNLHEVSYLLCGRYLTLHRERDGLLLTVPKI